jgi:dTMP kinase
MFISFEGIDGCGKSTQVRLLDERLRAEGRTTALIREPGNTPISEDIRAIVLNNKHAAMTSRTELLLYSAARAQVVETAIRPALEQGSVVICDRFADSTWAYQGFGRELALADIERCTAVATQGLQPNVTFFLDVSLHEAQSRCAHKQLDRMESAGAEFFERVIAGYRFIAEREPSRFLRIDATRSVEAIHEEIWLHVSRRLAPTPRIYTE